MSIKFVYRTYYEYCLFFVVNAKLVFKIIFTIK